MEPLRHPVTSSIEAPRLRPGLVAAAAAYARRVRSRRWGADAFPDSEQHLRMLIDHVPAAVYSVDLDSVVLSWNPAATAMFGWSEAEAVGRVLPFTGEPSARLVTYCP